MEKDFCKSCKYFRQHYVLNEKRLFRVHCGHCVQHPLKRRKPDAIACDSFVFALPDAEAFVSKEYLSKELLNYVMSLEMLPQIEDLPK